jgi:hypothetical protein
LAYCSRADTEQVLGVVGKEYKIVQNKYTFTFFDAIAGGNDIMYETAGALHQVINSIISILYILPQLGFVPKRSDALYKGTVNEEYY